MSGIVGRLMRPAPTIEAADSLGLAARRLRESGSPLLAVVRDDVYVGVLADADLARGLASGADPLDAAGDHVSSRPESRPTDSAAEGLRAMASAGVGEAIVLDADRRPLGLLLATALVGVAESPPAPAVVGGMATPFGVYLTSGAVSGGAPKWALVFTGATMFGLVAGGRLVEIAARARLPERLPLTVDVFLGSAPLILFVGVFRVLPLAGTHAAEHMTVHAIERGEPLEPRVVGRMPRVHIRCGTNLAVGATLFLGLAEAEWIPWPEVRLLAAILVTLFFWRPLGSAAQRWITTRPPTDAQVADGVRAGRALLLAHAEGGRARPNTFLRIWNSGLLQVMGGSLLAFGVVYLVGRLLGFDMSAF